MDGCSYVMMQEDARAASTSITIHEANMMPNNSVNSPMANDRKTWSRSAYLQDVCVCLGSVDEYDCEWLCVAVAGGGLEIGNPVSGNWKPGEWAA